MKSCHPLLALDIPLLLQATNDFNVPSMWLLFIILGNNMVLLNGVV